MSTHTGRGLEGRTVYTSDGEKLGKIDSVLVDEAGSPQYVQVRSGWFGTRHHTVPAAGLSPRDDDDLTAAYTKDQLESAPTFDESDDIDYDREQQIAGHYGTDVRGWDDSRDSWLAGEDLSRGPTPETRHPHGGVDDVQDTTQGPTPETRQAMRLTEDDPAAAGQPGSDARTRADVVGQQDQDLEIDAGGPVRDASRADMAETANPGTGRVRVRRWTQSSDDAPR